MQRSLLFVLLCLPMWLSAQAARAVIVFEDPGRITTMPVLAGGVKPGWQYIGFQVGDAFSGIPIGPRAWVTATHVSSGTGALVYDNAGTTSSGTYVGTRAATSGDLAVMVLDDGQPNFTAWAPVWSTPNSLTYLQDIYVYGRGTTRTTVVTNSDPVPNTPKGWMWGGWAGYDGQQSYGTNQLDNLVLDNGNVLLAYAWNQPTVQNGLPSTEGILALGDSGSGIFSYNPATSLWELVGINYAVEQVQTAPGQPYLAAAIYDARGFYYNNTLITGTTAMPASSYSTSIPHKYDFLAPYVALPEPAGWMSACAAAGLIAWWRYHRRAATPAA